MIASLRGKVLFRGVNRVIVDVSGVGYEVAVSLGTLTSISDGNDVFFHIHTSLRENALELFGFTAEDEKRLFELLISVSGIGPRTALTILSGVSADGLTEAILAGDVRRLTAIPGIGKKSGERIVLELKDKIRKLDLRQMPSIKGGANGIPEEDLISSLVNLGYKEREASAAARKVLNGRDGVVSLPDAVKAALKELMK